MNKSLNVFLSVLLCVVLCVGVLTSLYTTDDSSVSQPQYGYSSSTSTGVGAPALSFGTSASGDGLAVPMSSSRSRGGVRSSSPHRPVASSPNRLITSSPNSLITSSPNSLLTYMSSSQKATSFGGGSNTAGVSMSGGVVSATTQSPIANNQLSLQGVGTYLSSSSSISLPLRDGQGAGYNSLLPYSPEDILSSSNGMRAISGRRNAINYNDMIINWLQNWLSNNIITADGNGQYWISEADLRTAWEDYLSQQGTTPAGMSWEQFVQWFATAANSHKVGETTYTTYNFVPVGDTLLPLFALAIVYLVVLLVRRRMHARNVCLEKVMK